MRLDVIVVGESDKDASATAAQFGGVERRVFERFPADLQQNTLLRVHRFAFTRRDPKKSGIESVDILHEGALAYIQFAGRVGVGVIVRVHIPAFGRDIAHGVGSALQKSPVRIGRVGAGKTASHADHRDGDIALERFILRRQFLDLS